jgi:hypothetical protein
MTTDQIQKIAKHAHEIFNRNLGTGKNINEWLQYLDHNCSKEGGLDSEWNQAYAKVQDLIKPGSAYGERK